MTLAPPGGGGDDGVFAASQAAMIATGGTLGSDADDLQSAMSYFWSSTFDDALQSLPACLQQTLQEYQQTQTKPYADCIDKRQKLASALQNSTDLISAVDEVCASAFTDPTLSNVSLTHLLQGQ